MPAVGCKALYGIRQVCGDNIYPSGADPSFWVGYVSDLSNSISITQTGVISSLSFAAYAGLVRFDSNKFAHKYDVELTKAAGGNISYLHRAIVKMINLSLTDDIEVQRLTQAQDAFIIYANNNEQFFIMGARKGLTAIAGALQSTGQNTGDDVSTTITLEGAEKTLPLRFEVSDYATTLLYLNNRVA